MTIYESLVAWFLADTDIAAAIADRIEPSRTMQAVADGARIEWNVLGKEKRTSLTKRRGLAKLVITYNFLATEQALAQAAADAVDDLVDPEDGNLDVTLPGDWLLQHCRIVDGSHRSGHWPPLHSEGVGTYHVGYDVEYWYQEV